MDYLEIEQRLHTELEGIIKKKCSELDNEHRLYVKYDKKQGLSVEIRDIHRRISTPGFKIEFDNGDEIPASGESMNSTDVLCKFIERIGVERVYEMGIKTIQGENLIQRDTSHNEWNLRPIKDGYWVITKTNTDVKIKQIKLILQEIEDKETLVIEK